MKRGTASRVFFGVDKTNEDFGGLLLLSQVTLGKKSGMFDEHKGLCIVDNVLLGKGIARVISVIIRGTSPLSLPDAIADSLAYVKAFGGTELVPETYIDSVVANGKCEQRNLPAGYTELEYIESTGTQYIDPDVSGNARWVITAQANAVKGSSQSLISSSPSASGGTWYGEFTSTGHWDIVSGGTNIPPTTKTTADLTFDSNGVRGTIGSTSVERVVAVTQGTWRIFATTGGGSTYPFAGKLFDAKVYQNGTLVRDFVPAKNSSGVIGMYDTASGQFFTNAGTGDFVAGTEVVPTPDTPMDIVSNNGVLKASKNLINLTTTTAGYYYQPNGTYTESSPSRLTDYIPVKAGQKYTVYYKTASTTQSQISVRINFFNSSKVWQSQEVLTLPAGAEDVKTITATIDGYVRISANSYSTTGLNADWNTAQMVSGEYTVATMPTYRPYGEIYTDGTVETIEDTIGNTATAEMLLKVGDYQDVQEILAGDVTRKVGVKVLDGTENWSVNPTSNAPFRITISDMEYSNTIGLNNIFGICSHFQAVANTASWVNYNNMVSVIETSRNVCFRYLSGISNVNTFKQYLANQYAAGTPVMIIYPLATPTTESVAGQLLTKEPLTITGSLEDLTATVTSSEHTVPTPTNPLKINSNNGVLKYGKPIMLDSTRYYAYLSVNLTDWSYSSDSYSIPIPVTVGHKYKITVPTTNPLNGAQNTIFRYAFTDSINTDWTSSTATGQTSIPVYDMVRTNPQDTPSVEITATHPYMIIQMGANVFSYILANNLITITDQSIYADGTVETINVHGKNLFDPTKVLFGYYRDRPTGDKTQNSSNFMSSDDGYIPCLPNTTYTFVGTNKTDGTYSKYNTIYFFDSAKNYLGASPYELSQPTTGTTPSNCHYLQVRSNPLDNSTPIQDAFAQFNWQLEQGSTVTEYAPYYNGGTATAEMLLKVGDYQDVQSILDGVVTRKVGVKVLDGTEDWSYAAPFFSISLSNVNNDATSACLCTNYLGIAASESVDPYTQCVRAGRPSGSYKNRLLLKDSNFTSTSALTAFLADQYAAGTPVIVLYPLTTETTESVAGQTLQVQAGDNTLEITQASMSGLELEAQYQAAVSLTIQEVQDANLDPNVEVTIN